MKQLWKRQNSSRRFKRDHSDSFSKGNREVTCYKCNELGHYKYDCPKLKKEVSINEGSKKNNFKGKNKGLTETWDDSEASGSDSDEEYVNVSFTAIILE